VQRVDGRDHQALAVAMRRTAATVPTLVVAEVEDQS